jgi:large subunit ribosomal protein L25
MLTINASKREIVGKATARIGGDEMPAVFYGRKEKSTPVTILKSEFKKIYKDAGESTVISLKVDGKGMDVLIHEVDVDPIKHEPRHVDFYVLEKGKKIEVNVPVNFIGVAPAMKLGGIVVKVLHEIEIEADPTNLPHEIDVDLSALENLDSQILVKDVRLPNGVVAKGNPEEVVAAISVATEEKEVPASVDISAIEVEKKGKKEESPEEGK